MCSLVLPNEIICLFIQENKFIQNLQYKLFSWNGGLFCFWRAGGSADQQAGFTDKTTEMKATQQGWSWNIQFYKEFIFLEEYLDLGLIHGQVVITCNIKSSWVQDVPQRYWTASFILKYWASAYWTGLIFNSCCSSAPVLSHISLCSHPFAFSKGMLAGELTGSMGTMLNVSGIQFPSMNTRNLWWFIFMLLCKLSKGEAKL